MAHRSAARASSPSLCALLLLGAVRQAATLQLQLASNSRVRAATTTEAATRAGAPRLIVTESCTVCHTQGSNPGRAEVAYDHSPHATAHQCIQTGLLLTRARLALDSGASPSVSRPRRASTRTLRCHRCPCRRRPRSRRHHPRHHCPRHHHLGATALATTTQALATLSRTRSSSASQSGTPS